MATTYSITQQLMTLAGLAATGATPRASGESLADQTRRILDGINRQLAVGGLATGGAWKAFWVGLTADRANLVYLAQQGPVNPLNGPAAYAVVLRGTAGGSALDTAEDMKVGTLLPFAAGGPAGRPAGNISQGAMEAFTEIVMGTDLMTRLAEIARPPRPGLPAPTIYVTGHSLGGALATTVGLYLAVQSWGATPPKFAVYTFAAPTAGDAGFAAAFDAQFPDAVCVYNYYDVVPYAWASLASIYDDATNNPFYPGGLDKRKGPGPTATRTNAIGIAVEVLDGRRGGNTYVQPTRQAPLNYPLTTYTSYDGPLADYTALQQFEVQVGFQHANNTYLALLAAPTLPPVAPVVASLSPATGPQSGGTAVTIKPPRGVTFSQESVVDFGVVPARSVTVAADGSSITAVAPPGAGTVDVTVTNDFGTSPLVPGLATPGYSDRFAYTP